MIGRCLMGLAALALVAARPDTYRENEEFKYARSSTDEGTKSGFYEAQRGNVGGNYERAHNMDRVAQGQMSDIVTQVGGQAGEVADARHGELYGSAFNRGIYGQRQWDTTNLAGRSFQETAGSHSAYSGSAASSSSSQRGSSVSSYGSGASTLGSIQYDLARAGLTDTAAVDGSTLHQTGADTTYGSRRHSSSSGYQQYSGSSQRAESFDQNAITSDQGSQYTIVPVRVVVRPLTPVRVPFAREQVAGSSFSQTDEERSRAQSQNSITQSDGRIHGSDVAATGGLGGRDKHYSSSYDYHKEWEKHSEVTPIPLSVVTSNPLSEPVTSYSQQQLLSEQDRYRSQSQSSVASDARYVSGSRDYSALDHQTGAQSGYHYQRVAEPIGQQYVVHSRRPEYVVTGTRQGSYGARSQHASDYSTGTRSQSHTAYGDDLRSQGQLRTSDDSLLAASSRSRDTLTTMTGGDRHSDSTAGTGPKSYESSYSYHKAWERQGDPYVIVPASTGTAGQSGRLQTSSLTGYGAQQTRHSSYGSHSGTQEDCDESQRRVRSAHYTASAEDLGQQVQTSSRGQEELGQQTVDLEHDREDLGQQVVDLGQQVVDLGQVESSLETSEALSQQQDLRQQAQDDLGQQTVELDQHVAGGRGYLSNPTGSPGLSRIEDLGQQTQEDLGQQVVDLGQEGAGEYHSRPIATHSLSQTAELGQHTQDLGQRVVGPHVANPSYSFRHQQAFAQSPETYQSHRTQQAGMTDKRFKHTEFGQQYTGFGQTQVRHNSQEGRIGSDEYMRQIQQAAQEMETFAQHNGQSEDREAEVRHIGQGQWIGSDEYMRQIQQAARELETFVQQNSEMEEKHRDITSFVHSDYGKHSEQVGEHYLQETRQSAHHSFAHAEHQDGQEVAHQHQQHQTYRYHEMPHSWRPLQPVVSVFPRENNKTQRFGQDTSQDGQQQTFLGNFGPSKEDEVIQLTDQSAEKDHYIQEEGSIVLAPNNDKERSVPILRGDLGTLDTITDTTSYTTAKSLTEDELTQHLHYLLSHANESREVNPSEFPRPTSHYIPDKVKTPKEIESLSLVKDLDQYTEKTDEKIHDFSQQSVDAGMLELTNKKSEDVSSHHSPKPEIIGQELVSLDQQSNNESQQTINTDMSYQESEYTGASFNGKTTDQIIDNPAQVFQQQTEGVDQQVTHFEKTLDEMGQETIRLDQKSTGPESDIGTSFDRKPEDHILENSAQMFDQGHRQVEEMGQQLASFDKTLGEMGQETLSLDQHSTGQQREGLHNWGESGEKVYSLDQQTQDFGQQTQSMDQSMEGKDTLSLDQHSTGQEREDLHNWGESGEKVYSLDQQTQDFGQQTQSMDQSMEGKYFDQSQQMEDLGQQVQDLGQQVQSFDKDTMEPKTSKLEVQPLEIVNKESSAASKPLEEKPGHSHQKDESKAGLMSPAEESSAAQSESPGFWKSVGHRITVAKDKVTCWFSKCT